MGNMGCLFGRPSHGEDLSRDYSRPMSVVGAHTLEEVRLAPGVFIKVISGSFRRDYEILKVLGSGSFGKVYEAKHTQSGIARAVKEISKEDAVPTDGERTKFIREVEILAMVDHPNVVKVFELYEDEYKFAVVSEYVSGGELFSYIVRHKHLTEVMAATIMTQLLSALRYLHKCNIVHRDLKPENILLDQEPTSKGDINIKIIDFGASSTTKKNLHEVIGSLPYLAPEVLKKSYNEKCDLWSAGCILYTLLSGTMPFFGANETVTKYQIESCDPQMSSQNWRTVSNEAKHFLTLLLTKDPVKRPSAEEALLHPWIQHNSYSRVEATQVSLAVDNLKKFCGGSKLQQAVSLFITTYVLTREEKQHLTDIFTSLDTDHDGVVTKDELLTGLARRMSSEEAQAQVDLIMSKVDMDNSGTINYTEFVAVSVAMNRQMSKSALEQAFQMIDTDHSGKIDVSELKSLLGTGLITDEALWTTLINSADKNEDGGIDSDEFMELMRVAYE